MAISDYMEDLIYRVLVGEASVEEREEFETWLRENAEHRVFFENGKVCGPVEERGDECRMESSGTQEGTEAKASFQTNRVECGCECGCADWDYMACGIVGRRNSLFGCGSVPGGKTG